MVFHANIWYKDIIKDYVLSGVFCSVVHFPYMVMPFLPNCQCRVFFSNVCVTFLCSTVHATVSTLTVLNQTKLPHLPIHTGRQKGGLILSTPGVLLVNHLPLFLSQHVCWLLLYEMSQIHNKSNSSFSRLMKYIDGLETLLGKDFNNKSTCELRYSFILKI